MSKGVRIVVLDGHTLNPGDNPWTGIESLGDLTVYDRTPVPAIIERATGASVVLTNKTPLDSGTLEQLSDLRCIAVLATGHDVVDGHAARRLGITVCNVPEYGTDSVAQHTFALILELCHMVGDHDRAVHQGKWQSSPDFAFWLRPPIELRGRTIGIVGFGRIGRRVAALARTFGMHILVHNRSPVEIGEDQVSLDELCRRSDIVTLHCPLTATNQHLIDQRTLALMRPTALSHQHRTRCPRRRNGAGECPQPRHDQRRCGGRRIERTDSQKQSAAVGATMYHYATSRLGQSCGTPTADGNNRRERESLFKRRAGEPNQLTDDQRRR